MNLLIKLLKSTDDLQKKGCLSDLNAVEQKECKDNTTLCNLCKDVKNCNEFNTRSDEKCIRCNSKQATDTKCATHPGELLAVQCLKKSEGKCITNLNELFIFRGCYSELDSAMNKSATAECEGQGCNNKIYPEKRLQCYHCDSTKDKSCKDEQKSTNTTLLYPCEMYKNDDKCYAKITEGDEVYRGCNSDLRNVDPCADKKKDSKCVPCDEKNGCNSQDEKYLNSSVVNKINIALFAILTLSLLKLR